MIWYRAIILIFFKIISLALGQWYNSPSANEAALKNMGQLFSWLNLVLIIGLNCIRNCSFGSCMGSFMDNSLITQPRTTWIVSIHPPPPTPHPPTPPHPHPPHPTHPPPQSTCILCNHHTHFTYHGYKDTIGIITIHCVKWVRIFVLKTTHRFWGTLYTIQDSKTCICVSRLPQRFQWTTVTEATTFLYWSQFH